MLERATQTRPTERYQTVQDFWDELNDAGMPVTQPLIFDRVQRPISSDLNVEAEVLTAAAPPRPSFETARELQHQEVAGNGATRPKIVVPIAGHSAFTRTQDFAPNQQPGRLTVPVPRNGLAAASRSPGPKMVAPRRKHNRDFVVGVVLVLCFAGILVATGAYVRSWIKQRATQQTPTANITSIVGREALTSTDVNLRAGPNSRTDAVGLAESGSRVQVLTVSANGNWCEVQVVQHARPKDDSDSADRGWVNRIYLKFD